MATGDANALDIVGIVVSLLATETKPVVGNRTTVMSKQPIKQEVLSLFVHL